MAYFFTVYVIDREHGEKYKRLEAKITKQFPMNGVEGVLGVVAAMSCIKSAVKQQSHPPQMVAFVIEIEQDDGDGLDVIRAIRKSRKLSDIPIIIFTDSKDEEKISACMNTGAEAHFSRGNASGLISYLQKIHDSGKWRPSVDEL